VYGEKKKLVKEEKPKFETIWGHLEEYAYSCAFLFYVSNYVYLSIYIVHTGLTIIQLINGISSM